MKRSEAEKVLEQDIKGLLQVGLYTPRDIASFCIYRMEQLGMLPPEMSIAEDKYFDKDITLKYVKTKREWEPE